MKKTLLVVDDDEEIRTQMRWTLEEEYKVVQAGDREAAVKAFRSAAPVLTLLDLGLPPCPNDITEGTAILEHLLEIDPTAKIIVISGQGDRENAVEIVGKGAYDFLCKPVDTDELLLVVQRCVHVAELELSYRQLQATLQPEGFEGMLGSSGAMQAVFAMLKKVAGSSAPALILGESGTGKEMVARAVHQQSARRAAPFVAINCSAIPENLLESELFGHEKGSFTGADRQRKGLIEGADGGTLFLDEIGELSAPLQVKLLRFLQERRLQRVGGREEFSVDTRVVAATNADLQDAIVAGSFREDLYFRLAVVVLGLPPLRDRDDDAVLLARRFLTQYAEENDKRALAFSPNALSAIRRHSWPGNVRELQNRVQRAVIMTDGKQITPDDLELDAGEGDEMDSALTLKEARDQLERRMLQAALILRNGSIAAVASQLGISRPTVYEMMERLGVSKPAKASVSKSQDSAAAEK